MRTLLHLVLVLICAMLIGVPVVYAGSFAKGFMDSETGEILTYEQALERGIVEEEPSKTSEFSRDLASGETREEVPRVMRIQLKEEGSVTVIKAPPKKFHKVKISEHIKGSVPSSR